jgi:hypothetical protein
MPRAKVLPVPARPTTRATPWPPWHRSRTIACWSVPAVGWAVRASRTAWWEAMAVCSPVRPVAAATRRCSTVRRSGVDQRRSSRARSATTLTARFAKNRSASSSSSVRPAPANPAPRATRTSGRVKVDAVAVNPSGPASPSNSRTIASADTPWSWLRLAVRPVTSRTKVSGSTLHSAAPCRQRPYRMSGALCSLGLRMAWTAHLTCDVQNPCPQSTSRNLRSPRL